MGRLIGFAAVLFVGVVGWRLGDGLSADALGMAVGVLLGVLAMIPIALLALSGRRDNVTVSLQVMAVRQRDKALRREVHNHHYHIHQSQQVVDIVPPGVALAAQRWGGVARWDDEGQYWLIINPTTGRIVARQRKQIATEQLLLQA